MPSIKFKRGTRTQIEAAKTASGLGVGEPYLITDESRFALGTAADAYSDFAKKGEVDGKEPDLGNPASDGQVLSSTAAGVRSWVDGGGGGLTNVTYDNRSTLRTNETDTHVLVDGLGLFQYVTGSDEPDDDESCFATTNGRWLLQAAHWDVVDSWQSPNDDYQQNKITEIKSLWPGRITYYTFDNTLLSLSGSAIASQNVYIPGVKFSDIVLVVNNTYFDSSAAGKVLIYARVTIANYVTIFVNNTDSAGKSMVTGTWILAILRNA